MSDVDVDTALRAGSASGSRRSQRTVVRRRRRRDDRHAPLCGRPDHEIARRTCATARSTDVYETLVNPRALDPAVRHAAHEHLVGDGAGRADVSRRSCDNCCDVLDGHVFVAHNAGFDWRFVSREVSRASRRASSIGRRLCTVRLARRLLPQLPRRSLDCVARHYGVEITRAASRRRRCGRDRALPPAAARRRARTAAAHAGASSSVLLAAAHRCAQARRRRRSAMPTPVDKDTTA